QVTALKKKSFFLVQCKNPYFLRPAINAGRVVHCRELKQVTALKKKSFFLVQCKNPYFLRPAINAGRVVH
ncbi:hypothetical protein, partial [Escherichia coli]|uniref:hypothetical protein n=1 Tax=Escherichia coli TaxID=562 RepID=UPI001BCE049E